MTREEIILKHIKRNGRGLEIGPGCAPIALKKQGFHVHVLDHCDKKALIEKYRPHGINVENIKEVDSVWDTSEKGEFEFVHSFEQAKQAIRDVSERGYYLDVHEWCFTPTSFRLMMRDLFELGFIQLKEFAFHPPQGSEFYITLSRQGHLPEGTRLELLGQILREQSAS